MTYDHPPNDLSGQATHWRPGMPVLTPADEAAWQEWRKEQRLEQQRARRAELRRIDYYPCPEATAIIDAKMGWFDADKGQYLLTYASVIDRIVMEWRSFRNTLGGK